MREPDIHTDSWCLLSGEERHAASPDNFWIPSTAERSGLARGHAAKLLFKIEAEDEQGHNEIAVERIWVIISEKIGDTYIGILDGQPASIKPSDDVYLCFGAEIPFKAEHVIDIDSPPAQYVDWQLNQKPERVWPRGTL